MPATAHLLILFSVSYTIVVQFFLVPYNYASLAIYMS